MQKKLQGAQIPWAAWCLGQNGCVVHEPLIDWVIRKVVAGVSFPFNDCRGLGGDQRAVLGTAASTHIPSCHRRNRKMKENPPIDLSIDPSVEYLPCFSPFFLLF
jgi:hypothetical protein